uniref:LamG domain-containing protein n=1 Tax=Schlesneria paludicola TaxID=360056 RepID=A0A7C2P1U1_9PLAN
MIRCAALMVALSLAACPLPAAEPPAMLLGYPLLFHDDFSAADTARWEPADPKAWKLVDQNGNQVFNQFAQSKVETPVRSPFNRCVLKDLIVGDFVLDVKLQSTARDYPHRSLCLFFGYQDPAHMYYVHFGQKADDHANQIFIVNNEPRKKISTKTTEGTPWDNHWHHARIVRKVDSGEIAVYFDDMETPVMTAVDRTFTWGQVGIGSFDDTGNFDDVRVHGVKVKKPE